MAASISKTLRQILLGLLILCGTSLAGCGSYDVAPRPPDVEQVKKEFMLIEDTRVGNRSQAGWGMRISANIEVRYTDGTLIYRGPIVYYHGFKWGYQRPRANLLAPYHIGLRFGIEGMGIGGQRRIMIHPDYVCGGVLGTMTSCRLFEKTDEGNIAVDKTTLVVDVTLADACIPMVYRAGHICLMGGCGDLIDLEVGCRSV